MVGCMTCRYHSTVAGGFVRCNHPKIARVRKQLAALASNPDQYTSYISQVRRFVFTSKEGEQHIRQGEGYWPDKYLPEWVEECKLVAGGHTKGVFRNGDGWEARLVIGSHEGRPGWIVTATCRDVVCLDKSESTTMWQAAQQCIEAFAYVVGRAAHKIAVLIENQPLTADRYWKPLRELLQASKSAYLEATEEFGVKDPPQPAWMNLELPDSPTPDAIQSLKEACSEK
jgi:hypothetical protein